MFSHGAKSYAIEFSNFGYPVELTIATDNQYFVSDDIKVQVANRVVLKTSKGVTKDTILKTDRRITDVQELYRLKRCTYYLVTFHEIKDLPEIIDFFEYLPFVISVQPDLLQLKEESLQPEKQRKKTLYIDELGIRSLWKTTKGKGVKVAIIDDGFDLDHEDLQGVTLSFGYDLEHGNLDPSPRYKNDTHGTGIAGVIFSQHNDIGINGIAPEAELIALRHADTWTSKTLLSFYLAKKSGADIINCSWNSQMIFEPVADVIQDLAKNGRDGKGIAVVFAAGNNGIELQENSIEATLPQVITVGSMGLRGKRLPFSNYGKSVDIYTYGRNILTLVSGPVKYNFLSGTSASAAIVTGIIALYLSQDSTLSLGQIQEQLLNFFKTK